MLLLLYFSNSLLLSQDNCRYYGSTIVIITVMQINSEFICIYVLLYETHSVQPAFSRCAFD